VAEAQEFGRGNVSVNTDPALLLFILAGGVSGEIFMAKVIWRTLVTGALETKPGARPITKASRPLVYWGFTIWLLLGCGGTAWALVLAASRLAHSN
jgi:hypothetical protein